MEGCGTCFSSQVCLTLEEELALLYSLTSDDTVADYLCQDPPSHSNRVDLDSSQHSVSVDALTEVPYKCQKKSSVS